LWFELGALSTTMRFWLDFSCIFVTLEQSLDETQADTEALCQLAVRAFLIVVGIDNRPLAKVIAEVLWGLKLGDRLPIFCARSV
jgi:hypothetical protein